MSNLSHLNNNNNNINNNLHNILSYNNNNNLNNNENYYNDLIIAWKNEKLCKNLMPYEEILLINCINLVENYEKKLKDNTEQEFYDFILQDVQRMKFLIKDYLRIRLIKIEKYIFYILKNDLSNLLSQNEINFVIDLIKMKSIYFNEGMKKLNIFVNNFRPFLDNFKKMSEKINCLNEVMIVSPPKNEFVIVKNISQEPIIINLNDIIEGFNFNALSINPEEIVLLPYNSVHNYIKEKKLIII
jgi:hypothetical protein